MTLIESAAHQPEALPSKQRHEAHARVCIRGWQGWQCPAPCCKDLQGKANPWQQVGKPLPARPGKAGVGPATQKFQCSQGCF
jgi:hypothetical protein